MSESALTLIGHWPLKADGADHSGRGNDALTIGGVRFKSQGAVLDGRGGHLEIPSRGIPRLWDGPFSITARIHVDSADAEVIGDIASKFDPRTRTGFNFSVADHGGVTSASSNYRNLNFSIDSGTTPQWADCGRVGSAAMIFALAVNDGELYASTFEMGEGGMGHVYRYVGGERWEDTGVPCKANAVTGLASLDGHLYAASGQYDARGSSMGDAMNLSTECRVWRLEKNGTWSDCGAPPGEDDQFHLGIYRGRIYATPAYRVGLYRHDGGTRWTTCAQPYPRFFALSQWRGHLYAGTNKSWRHLGPPPQRERTFTFLPDADAVYRYDDRADAWTGCGKIESETQMYCFSVHRGSLYVGTWPSAKMYRSTHGIGWEDCGRVHPQEEELMGVGIYNGMMYTGTLPAADIYRFDGDHRWTNVGHTDQTQGVKYRRAWSMAVHDGRLFIGTLPSGHVFSMRAGAVASDSRQLTSGWHDVAAERDADGVRLRVDGRVVARNPDGGRLDLSNDEPLRIGFGAYDYFKGTIADVRLHARV